MRLLKIILICIILLLTAATLLGARKISTDFDRRVDFSKYKTFMWIKEPKTTNPLMKDRIIEAVNKELQSKELRLVHEDADLGVAANTATRKQHTLETFYDGFPGGWRWHRGWGGPSTTYVETYTVGTLVVDLFDAHTKQVVWWGSASDTVSDKPAKNEKKLNEAAEKMFKDFPPKPASH